jgi:hypothetical protein
VVSSEYSAAQTSPITTRRPVFHLMYEMAGAIAVFFGVLVGYLTLSVVTSTRVSPSATESPTALSHREMVHSATDSPIAGRIRGTLSATV